MVGILLWLVSCLLVCFVRSIAFEIKDDFQAPAALPLHHWHLCANLPTPLFNLLSDLVEVCASVTTDNNSSTDGGVIIREGDLLSTKVSADFFTAHLPLHFLTRSTAFDPDILYFQTQFQYSVVIEGGLQINKEDAVWMHLQKGLLLRLESADGAVLCDLPHNLTDLFLASSLPQNAESTIYLMNRTIIWPSFDWTEPTHAAQHLSLRPHLVYEGPPLPSPFNIHTFLATHRPKIRFRLHAATIAYFAQPGKLLLHDTLATHQLFSAAGGKTALLRLPLELYENPCLLLGTSHAIVLNQIHIAQNLSDSDPQDQNYSKNSYDDNNDTNNRINTQVLPRVLCLIYTTASHLQSHLSAQTGSWLRKCTAYLIVSDITTPAIIPIISTPNTRRFSAAEGTSSSLPIVVLPFLGDESYANLWQKIRSLWKYVCRHYSADFDWFLLGGDDLYVIMENLYAYLASSAIQKVHQQGRPMYLGRQMRFNVSQSFQQQYFSESPEDTLLLLRRLHTQTETAHHTKNDAHNSSNTYASDEDHNEDDGYGSATEAEREAEEARYQSGGAGYVLNSAALRVLSSRLSVLQKHHLYHHLYHPNKNKNKNKNNDNRHSGRKNIAHHHDHVHGKNNGHNSDSANNNDNNNNTTNTINNDDDDDDDDSNMSNTSYPRSDSDRDSEATVWDEGCKPLYRTSIEDALVGQCLYRMRRHLYYRNKKNHSHNNNDHNNNHNDNNHNNDNKSKQKNNNNYYGSNNDYYQVVVTDTRDAQGRERFHMISPGAAFEAPTTANFTASSSNTSSTNNSYNSSYNSNSSNSSCHSSKKYSNNNVHTTNDYNNNHSNSNNIVNTYQSNNSTTCTSTCIAAAIAATADDDNDGDEYVVDAGRDRHSNKSNNNNSSTSNNNNSSNSNSNSNSTVVVDSIPWMVAYAGHPIQSYIRCCAPSSISFHYVAQELMLAIDSFLYRCPRDAKDAYYHNTTTSSSTNGSINY